MKFKSLTFAAVIGLVVSLVSVAPAYSNESGADSGERIIGGTTAPISDAPWQVALIDTRRGANNFEAQFCGGSIYSATWIITAAHCLEDGIPASNLRVMHSRNDLSLTQIQGITAKRYILHPSYVGTAPWPNDIALIELSSPIPLQANLAQPIALPTIRPAAGSPALITGWGNTVTSGTNWPQFMQKAAVEVYSDAYCSSAYSGYSNNVHVCASGATFTKATCQGDSGGPLAVYANGRWELHGVTSFGVVGCAVYGYPSVFAETANYVSWIQSNAVSAPLNFTTAPLPTISGTVAVGQTLSANVGSWSPTPSSFGYQWLANNSPIPSATGQTFVVPQELVGARLSVTVTASLAGYNDTQRASVQTVAVPGPPVPVSGTQQINGVTQIGQTLTANLSIWGEGVTHTFVWRRGTSAISGATGSSYVLAQADLNQRISVVVTGSKPGHTSVTLTSPQTAAVTAAFSAAPTPTITGTPTVGQTLTAVPGVWTPTPRLAYQWLRNGAPISGATRATYRIVLADSGQLLSVRITATLSNYPTTVRVSSAAGPVAASFSTAPVPTISGVLGVGQTLTANPGTWAPVPQSLAYQWMANGTDIAGATASTFVLASEHVGARLSVRVRASSAGFLTTDRVSAQTAAIPGPLLTASGPQVITGSASLGQTLSADLSIWGDGVAHTIVWRRGTATIAGATTSSYTLTPADVGQRISVAVTGSKSGFMPLTLTSAQTQPVAGVFSVTPTPQIVGTASVGQTLSASAGSWSPSPTLSYQWLRAGSPISGATRSTYVIAAADLGTKLSVTVTGTLTNYPTTAVTSAETAAVSAGTFSSTPAPTITGSLVRGGTLTANVSGWTPTPTSISYQWLRNGASIAGANARTYVITNADAGQAISVQVSGSAAGYQTASMTSSTRSDWTYRTATLATYTAGSIYANCIAAGAYGYSWQNVGDTFWPCDPYSTSGVDLYDPSNDMMIIWAAFGIPTEAIRYRLTFGGISHFTGNFMFIASDSDWNLDESSAMMFPFYPATSMATNWVNVKETGRLDYLIAGSGDYGDGGFLSFTTVKVEYQYIQ